jgi:hypothetical protein
MRAGVRMPMGVARRHPLGRWLDIGRVRVAVGGLLGGPGRERDGLPVRAVRVVVPVVGEMPHRSEDPAADKDGELHDRGLTTGTHGLRSLAGDLTIRPSRSLMVSIDTSNGESEQIRLTRRLPRAQYRFHLSS